MTDSVVIGADPRAADRPARGNARRAAQLSRDSTATGPPLPPGTCAWRFADPTGAFALVGGPL
jgi:hypothetical protein